MGPNEIIYIVGTVGYMGLEYWLGKTNKVEPGSVLEALFFVFKKMAGKT